MLSDEDILERGGTQEDIESYAHDVGGACGAAYGGKCDYCGKPGDTPKRAELDHSQEDEITRLLVGFANELLAYDKRMTERGSMILFIHDYVAKRKKRFDALVEQEIAEARIDELERIEAELLIDDSLALRHYYDERLEALRTKEK